MSLPPKCISKGTPLRPGYHYSMASPSELWVAAKAAWCRVEESGLRGDSEEFKKLVDECQDLFQQVGQRVNELGLFSRNETIRDVNTATMPYFLVPYYLALIQQRRMTERRVHLEKAKVGPTLLSPSFTEPRGPLSL